MDANRKYLEKKGGSASDHLANERTYLAWIRTSIAIMAFGFVVVKFSLFVKQLSFMVTDKAVVMPSQGQSGEMGLLLVILGALVSLLAFLRYKKIERQLNNNAFYPSSTLILMLSLLILIGSIFMLLYLLPNIRS